MPSRSESPLHPEELCRKVPECIGTRPIRPLRHPRSVPPNGAPVPPKPAMVKMHTFSPWTKFRPQARLPVHPGNASKSPMYPVHTSKAFGPPGIISRSILHQRFNRVSFTLFEIFPSCATQVGRNPRGIWKNTADHLVGRLAYHPLNPRSRLEGEPFGQTRRDCNLVVPSKGCSHVNQITHESIFSRN
ncbi:MAG: hypothetical protein RL630_718 [Verrucomicrobiota bacterium]|jgi:hypothetical protein